MWQEILHYNQPGDTTYVRKFCKQQRHWLDLDLLDSYGKEVRISLPYSEAQQNPEHLKIFYKRSIWLFWFFFHLSFTLKKKINVFFWNFQEGIFLCWLTFFCHILLKESG